MSDAMPLPTVVHTFYGTFRMLWAKVSRIVFIALWFAGLSYLSCIFVNLAMETERATITRLLTMARRLSRFTTILAIVMILLGLWLFLGYRIGPYPPNDWIHVRFAPVPVMIGYRHGCGVLLHKFEADVDEHPHRLYRWFNELPVLLLLAVMILVVTKSFRFFPIFRWQLLTPRHALVDQNRC